MQMWYRIVWGKVMNGILIYTQTWIVVQAQTLVIAYFSSEQLLLFVFVWLRGE